MVLFKKKIPVDGGALVADGRAARRRRSEFKEKTSDKISDWFKRVTFPLLIDFLKWKIIDAYRAIKNPKKCHLFGIWCYVGIYGGGKTISLVRYLERLRAKYGNNILIGSNFHYKNQDFELTGWRDLLKDYEKPVIFAYDELQNEFNNREYRNFPIELMKILTQNRKGNGKQLVYTTQDYETVDKNFRRQTSHVVTCRTRGGRLTITRRYRREDYEHLISMTSVDKRVKIGKKTERFVQTDDLRNLYDSYKMLESARIKLEREENETQSA